MRKNRENVGASIARPHFNGRTRKTILIMLPILFLLIGALIAVGITNAANNATEPEMEQTFTEEGEGYYIWVRAVDHAGNKGPWSEAQRVWIDNKGPSAPVITGGSSEYALSRTISVSTVADDSGASGVAYYEYCKKSGADKPDASVDGTKVTTSATSQNFNTNIEGEYVFFRAVDVVGNKGAWSEGQQVCIDINEPTVSAKNSSVTITKGQNYAMSTYFNTDKNGNAEISSTTYKIGSTSYTNTSGLVAGTYTVTCTVTKVTGKTKNASMTLIVKVPGITAAQVAAAPSTYYGKTISNYSCTASAGVNAWKIFYADSNNIYIITDNYIHYDYLPKSTNYTLYKNSNYRFSFNDIVNDYNGSANILNTSITDSRVKKWISWATKYSTSTNLNIKAVAYMLDTSKWNLLYKNNTYADYAIGGPTLELFVASYNQRYPSLNIGISLDSDGYKVGTGGNGGGTFIEPLENDSLYVIPSSSLAYAYWIASPGTSSNRSLVVVAYESMKVYRLLCDDDYHSSYDNGTGFRPVVCLNTNVGLTANSNGTYSLNI